MGGGWSGPGRRGRGEIKKKITSTPTPCLAVVPDELEAEEGGEPEERHEEQKHRERIEPVCGLQPEQPKGLRSADGEAILGSHVPLTVPRAPSRARGPDCCHRPR